MKHRTLALFALSALSLALTLTLAAAYAQSVDLDGGERSFPDKRIRVGLPDDEGDDEGADCGPADPPCFDDENRFADCGNGTVTDQVTGKVWLKDATCLVLAYYTDANTAAGTLGDGTHAGCGLSDNSCPGDWRLPTKAEFDELIAQAKDQNGCQFPDTVFPDTEGLGCWSPGDVILNLNTFGFWTSTTDDTNPARAWYGEFNFGMTHKTGKLFICDVPDGVDCDEFPPLYGWPVRD